jgi:hypothetical protein
MWGSQGVLVPLYNAYIRKPCYYPLMQHLCRFLVPSCIVGVDTFRTKLSLATDGLQYNTDVGGRSCTSMSAYARLTTSGLMCNARAMPAQSMVVVVYWSMNAFGVVVRMREAAAEPKPAVKTS